MKKALLYIHGKNGQASEANRYKPLFCQYDVSGLDYQSATPWEAKNEIIAAYNRLCKSHSSVSIIAQSIGAYFTMHALSNANIEHAFFISPIVDMEKLIADMMMWANVSQAELETQKEIATSFGETLSWKYLCYVRQNPIIWRAPTDILYGENDNLTSIETVAAFAEQHNSTLTVMPNGEHWFHTAEQLKFLDTWLKKCLHNI